MGITPKQQLENLVDAMVEDIMAQTDAGIMAEAIEEHGSIEAVEAEAERIRSVLLSAFPVKQN